MRNVVLGTAGHVDHGKTALVRRLTGVNTDRLPEERARGMSIEIGVAAHTLPSGRVIDLVDVPGHQRFIHTMVSGVAGVDGVVLVVAADDGPMPQTEEHLDILGLLGVERGFAVLNKIDLVDEELLDMALQETTEMLSSTPLKGCPIVCASAKSGAGLQEVRRRMETLCRAVAPRDRSAAFRMAVDRVLKVPGAGTVVTGTVSAGSVRVGQRAELFPSRLPVKVRAVQCRGSHVESAAAGDRVGLNLPGVGAASIGRGIVVADPDSLAPSHLLNVRLDYLARQSTPLLSGVRIKVHTGTSEALGRVVLMERKHLLPGESAPAQLRLETPLSPAHGDRFILRSLSPAATIGGGTILEAASRKYRPRHPSSAAMAEILSLVYAGGRIEAADAIARERGPSGCCPGDLTSRLGVTESAARELLDALVRRGSLVSPAPGTYVNRKEFGKLKERVCETVKHRYDETPLERSIPAEEIRTKLGSSPKREVWQRALAELAEEGRLALQGSRLSIPGYLPAPTARQESRMEAILGECRNAGVKPLKPHEIERQVEPLPRNELATLISYLVVSGMLVRLDTGGLLTPEGLEAAKKLVLDRARRNGHVTLPEARDLLGIGRHPTQAILEHLNERGAMARHGDAWVKCEPASQPSRSGRGLGARSLKGL